MCTRPPSASTIKSFTARAGFFDGRGRKRMSKIHTRMLNLREISEKNSDICLLASRFIYLMSAAIQRR